MLPKHIHDANDLVTSRQSTREGFLAQALAKVEKATAYVERAREFWAALQTIGGVDELLDLNEFRAELVAAAGFSEKASNHILAPELDDSLKKVFDALYASEETAFREEILYRYLLIKGDALGGGMRNWTGAIAAQKLIAALDKALTSRSISPTAKTARGSAKVQRIEWLGRLLLFDVKPSLIGNNVDLILLDTSDSELSTEKALLAVPSRYLACGELKGGIDPAGADEHWKTASTAFDRIRESFTRLHVECPHLFFVGAAIEAAMARKIHESLQIGKLAHAANLTVSSQVQDLAEWLVTL